MIKKKIISLITAGTLLLGLTIGAATGAWFTDNKSSSGNVFNTGTLKLDQVGVITEGLTLTNIYPGWTSVEKSLTIVNKGSLNLKYYLSVDPLNSILYNGATPLQVNINNRGFVDINKLGNAYLGEINANDEQNATGTPFTIQFKMPETATNTTSADYSGLTAEFTFNFTANQLNAPVTATVYNEKSLKEALDNSYISNIELSQDITVSSPIEMNRPVIIDGKVHKIVGNLVAGQNIITIYKDNTTLKNIAIERQNQTSGHGINIYCAKNVLLDKVSVSNNGKSGITVNGSIVTVNDITTSNNVWGGINVDLGKNVVGPAKLTVTGTSNHNEANPIWIDDITKAVSVDDVNSQYNSRDIVSKRIYTLKTI